MAFFETRNFTTRLAGILISSPVAGLRPIRAFLFTRTSFPTPGIVKLFFDVLLEDIDERQSRRTLPGVARQPFEIGNLIQARLLGMGPDDVLRVLTKGE